MGETMKTIASSLTNEIIIERSRFIACITPLTKEDDFSEFCQTIRSLYPNASHYCSASVFGRAGEHQTYSDDHEPKGTAGLPMLHSLLHEGLTNIGIVVVRYFGGILLGTGGLRRAYTSSVKLALEKSDILEPVEMIVSEVKITYNQLNRLEDQLRREDCSLTVFYEDTHIRYRLVYQETYHETLSALVLRTCNYQYSLQVIERIHQYQKRREC